MENHENKLIAEIEALRDKYIKTTDKLIKDI